VSVVLLYYYVIISNIYACILCIIDINECSSYPCEHGGTCIDAVNMYACKCAAGFTDVHCKTSMSDTNTDDNLS